jgi:hypothetical protein
MARVSSPSVAAALVCLGATACSPATQTRSWQDEWAHPGLPARSEARVATDARLVRLRGELVARLDAIAEALASGAGARDGLLERRLALTVALAEIASADPASTGDELERAARDRVAAARARERTAAHPEAGEPAERRFVFDEDRIEGEPKPPDGWSSGDSTKSVTEKAPGGATQPPDDGVDKNAGDLPNGVSATRARATVAPRGVLRAVRRRAGAISSCVPSGTRDTLVRIHARIDPQGMLRSTRVDFDSESRHGHAMDGSALACIDQALRAVRVDGHDGQSLLVAFDLVVGAKR